VILLDQNQAPRHYDGYDNVIDFINDNDTVALIFKDNQYTENFFLQRPYMVPVFLPSNRFIIGYVSRNRVQEVFDDLGVAAVGASTLVVGLLGREDLQSAGILQVQEQPFLSLRGNGVLIGIVDTGIDYTNKAFIYEDGTSKIQYIYDQTIRSIPPEGLYIGTEYTREQINEALRSENPFDIVPSRDTVGHGTFLASVAAGRENGEVLGAAPDAELIIVKLKSARNYIRERFLIPPDQENAYETGAIMVGIEYILQKAQELDRPVAICIGTGTNLGGHDGFSTYENYLNNVASIRGVCVVTAAGNESQARHHTQGLIRRQNESVPIELRVGENAGNIYMSVWNGASDRMSVSIRSPTGELIERVPAKTNILYQAKLVLERSRVSVEYYFPVEGGGQLTAIKIYDATPGTWTITVYGDIILDGTFHSWLPITGMVSPNVEFVTPTPTTTIVVPGTAISVITAGAYNASDNTLYVNSSWGPTRLPQISPDLAAPGVNVSGAYPTGNGTMTGTSVASAMTTGAAALALQWGIVEGNDPSMSTFQVKALLIRGCSRDPNLAYPNVQWGYGRLNLFESLRLLREE
jgi:subtilisin family serine protease